MLDRVNVHNHIHALDNGDDRSRRQAIHSLKHYEEKQWASASPRSAHALVASLQHQLLNGITETSVRLEVVTILGNMGPRSAPAIPQLIELLQEGTPDGIREAAATALGKIGRPASLAID